jgi:ribokinase
MAGKGGVVILGIFVADTAYRAAHQPKMGETLLGAGFALGPGGKGSNQAVAAARAGAEVTFLSRIGQDPFGDMAMATWEEAGVRAAVTRSADTYTGAAYIFIDDATGDNAIIVCPGAATTITEADMDAAAGVIGAAAVFITQFEPPLPAGRRALEIARAGGAVTILNPAPAVPVDDAIWALCDYVTPNETEAEGLTGVAVASVDGARAAGDVFLAKGAGAALITLGEAGALLHTADRSELVPAFDCGPVVETTGAGDAFNGGFAAALARGKAVLEAVRFGCATAGLSVTRPGTAPSMPTLAEIETVLRDAPPLTP